MSPMTSFRLSVTVLAVMHALFAGFTALVGAFANGGDIWQRLLVVLLHPLGAAGVLVLVLRPRLATTTILALAALLTANVVADLGLAQLMAAGRVRGDWELALAFSVVQSSEWSTRWRCCARPAERSCKAPFGTGDALEPWAPAVLDSPGRRTASAPHQRCGESPVPCCPFR